MANNKTRAITNEEYKLILQTIENGVPEAALEANPKVGMVLRCMYYTGLRVGDVLRLTLGHFQRRTLDNKVMLVGFHEQKTDKIREMPINDNFYGQLYEYCIDRGITDRKQNIFKMTERNVQFILSKTVRHLMAQGTIPEGDCINTHSFRKLFGTNLYEASGRDIELVSSVFGHSATAVTRRYLGLTNERVAEALANMPEL